MGGSILAITDLLSFSAAAASNWRVMRVFSTSDIPTGFAFSNAIGFETAAGGAGVLVTFAFASKSTANAFRSCGWGERSLDWDRGERSLLVDPLAGAEGGDLVGAEIVNDVLFLGSLTRNLVAMSEVPS